MFLTVVVLGAIISSVTVIAGVLMSFQLRRSADVAASTRAIFAADAGSECMLYEIFGRDAGTALFTKVENCNNQGNEIEPDVFSNGVRYRIETTGEFVDGFGNPLGVPVSYKSIGEASNSVRSIDIGLNRQ